MNKDYIKEYVEEKWHLIKPIKGQVWIFDRVLAVDLDVSPLYISLIRSEIGCVLYRSKKNNGPFNKKKPLYYVIFKKIKRFIRRLK